MELIVKRYASTLANDWAKALKGSRNGIFLFDRSFVEYHGERFSDFSALAYMHGEPVALFPASFDAESGHACSHAGLTFGGCVFVRDMRGTTALAVIEMMLASLKEWGAKTLRVKILPQVFCTYPSGELEYCLWRRGFTIVRRDLSSILPLTGSLPFNKSKIQALKKARREGVVPGPASVADFHGLLERVLRSQHGAAPVHSLAEMDLLVSRFADEMCVRGSTKGGELVAGVLVFKYGHIWHTQYMAASEEGRSTGALDLIIAETILEARSEGATHLSFGASTEQAGTVLNEGLIWQKESYGARAITHDFMEGTL